jgi:transposase
LKTKKEKTKLRKAYKAEVTLSTETEKAVRFLSSAMIHLWNAAVVQAAEWLEKKEKSITAFSFNYWLTKKRAENITLKDGMIIALADISSDMEREVLRKLAGSYQSFFALKKNKDARARLPRTKEEHWFQTLSWSSFSIADGVLYAPGYKKERLEIPLGDYLREKIQGKEVVHATLAFDRHRGAFELSVVVASPLPAVAPNPTFFRAIDLGAGDVEVTDSDGSEFLIPARRSDKFWRKQVRHIEARVRLRNKRSRGWKRLMGARRRVFNKSYEQHVSYQRKLAHALVEKKVQCLIIGKPHTRLGLAKSKEGTPDQHWGAQNTGYMHRLMLYIKEKAEERGVKVLEYPDPQRTGNPDNPEDKFHASRALLAQGLEGTPLSTPVAFIQKAFCFKQ